MVFYVGVTLFHVSGDVCPGFESQGGVVRMLCYLCAMDSSDSSLVRHLLTPNGVLF